MIKEIVTNPDLEESNNAWRIQTPGELCWTPKEEGPYVY
jgi:hypothetical protein